MSKRGRKPVPTKIKELRGTGRPDRKLENEVQLDEAEVIPVAPKELSPEAKELWYAVCEQAKKIGLLSKIGVFQLERYVDAYDVYLTAKSNIRNKRNKIQLLARRKGSTGVIQTVKNPYWGFMQEAHKMMKEIETEWGFTPSSATRIPSPKQEDDKTNDEFDL